MKNYICSNMKPKGDILDFIHIKGENVNDAIENLKKFGYDVDEIINRTDRFKKMYFTGMYTVYEEGTVNTEKAIHINL